MTYTKYLFKVIAVSTQPVTERKESSCVVLVIGAYERPVIRWYCTC
jgi:hypothetical protein